MSTINAKVDRYVTDEELDLYAEQFQVFKRMDFNQFVEAVQQGRISIGNIVAARVTKRLALKEANICTKCKVVSENLRSFTETDAGGYTLHELCDSCYEILDMQQFENDWVIK